MKPPPPPPMMRKKGAPLTGRPSRIITPDVEADEEEQGAVPERKLVVTSNLSPKISKMQDKIGRLLKFSAFEPEQRYWLDTGFPDLNETLGSRELGLPYGKIIELSGIEHGGKTLLSTIIGGMCQRDGAALGYMDLENSYDVPWATNLGMDCSNVFLIEPKLISINGKKMHPKAMRVLHELDPKLPLQLESAEMMFAEAELAMKLYAEQGADKQFWMLDSVAQIQTQMAVDAGTTERNMRVNLDRAMFLSNVLPRWAALAASYNAMIFLLNQIRDKPGVMYGSPEYSPGGRALRHACAIRAKVRKGEKGGRLLMGKKLVGIKGVIKNEKNKAGQGSIGGGQVAFKIRWDKTPAQFTCTPVEGSNESDQ